MPLSLLLVLVSPLSALRIHPKEPARSPDASPNLKLHFYGGNQGGYDVIDKSHKYKLAAIPTERTERILRKVSKDKQHSWIVFAGDSNMRNTFVWWVKEQTKKGASAKLLKNYHLSSEEPWSDQEAVFEYPDGFEVRASFRFLHASENQFKFKTTHWHLAQKVPYSPKEDREIRQLAKAEDVKMDDPDAIQPSEQAMLAAGNHKLIDFKQTSPVLAEKLEKYVNEKPNAVIMTEGWGGIPGCARFDETLDLFKGNPDTKFVWSPVYVTNRTPQRHECFAQKIASVAQPDKNRNFGFVDMWDWTEKLPPMKKKNHNLKASDWDGSTPLHVMSGGQFMEKACERFEGALDKIGEAQDI